MESTNENMANKIGPRREGVKGTVIFLVIPIMKNKVR